MKIEKKISTKSCIIYHNMTFMEIKIQLSNDNVLGWIIICSVLWASHMHASFQVIDGLVSGMNNHSFHEASVYFLGNKVLQPYVFTPRLSEADRIFDRKFWRDESGN
jgi:hypothetical protein